MHFSMANQIISDGIWMETHYFSKKQLERMLKIARIVDSINYFNGLIDDVRIYDRALSAEEVQALYNLGQ